MKFVWFGHACVGLEAERHPYPGLRVLIDPYEAGGFGGQIGYSAIDWLPDLIVVSHLHADHAHVAPLVRPRTEVSWPDDRPQTTTALTDAVELRRQRASHDVYEGRRRGGSVDILRLSLDGLRIGHLTDIGEIPSQQALDDFKGVGGIDLLFVPCGGFYTVGGAEAAELAMRLDPKRIAAIHCRNDACRLVGLQNDRSFRARLAGDERLLALLPGQWTELS